MFYLFALSITSILKHLGDRFFKRSDERFDWIPVNPFDAFNEYYCGYRTQMPFRLAYALTIHKAQGQTLSQAIIDLGSIEYTLGLTNDTLMIF